MVTTNQLKFMIAAIFVAFLILLFFLFVPFKGTPAGNATGPAAPATLGPAPPGCSLLTTLEIINDRPIVRNDELAFSGIPIARNKNLLDANNLIVVDSAGNRVQAQFNVLSRWAASPDNLNAPIRWLQVAVKANVSANSITTYDLRECVASQVVSDPNDARIVSSGTTHTINTGVATFVLNQNDPALFQSMTINSVNTNYQTVNDGPVFIDGVGNSLLAYIGARDTFVIEEIGPVKVVVKTSGHFQRAANNPACGSDPSYVVRFTFTRGSADVGIEFDIVNECGTGFSMPFTENFPVREVAWNFPFANVVEKIALSDSAVYRASTSARAAQNYGNQNNPSGWRRAVLQTNGVTRESPEFLSKPLVGVRTSTITAAVQLAMMRYREPQALDASNNILSLKFIAEPKIIGEAQSVWNFAKLHLIAGNPTDAQLQTERDQGILEVERGLLLHVPVSYTNTVDIMPPLPSSNTAPNMATYLNLLNQIHAATVNPGGQWDDTKNYDLFIWPDYQFDQWPQQLVSPLQYSPTSNYWSASSSELKQWFVDGDPKWVWDFSWWMENHLLKTVGYSVGTRVGTVGFDIRSGFGVGSGGTPSEGNRYRTAESSDDYWYNQGTDEAYVVRPTGSFRDAFWRGGTTFIGRYNVPRSQQASRDIYVSSLGIVRGVVQHVNTLRYAAEFSVRDNQLFQNKLSEVINEYVLDNLQGGIPCANDYGNENTCGTGASFMNAALLIETFRDYMRNWGDINGVIGNMVSTYAQQHYALMTITANNVDSPTGFQCTFNNGQVTGCIPYTGGEPSYDHEQPIIVSMLLIAQDLDPSINLCTPLVAALPTALNLGGYQGYYQSGGGWFKGSAQGMRDVIHGIGVAEICGQAQPPAQFCGNGIVEGTEQCDDGNTANNDGCSSVCINEVNNGNTTIGTNLGDVDGNPGITIQDVLRVVNHVIGTLSLSGNGLVQGDTNCDGAVNIIDILRIVQKIIDPQLVLSCPIISPPSTASFFITSIGSDVDLNSNIVNAGGNYGGLAGADNRCQMLAQRAGITGRVWRAYLSTPTVNARDRIGTGPWYNTRGDVIASSVNTLHTAGIPSNLIYDELGNSILDASGNSLIGSTHDVLTGSAADGTVIPFPGNPSAPPPTCNSWTASFGDINGPYAYVGHADWSAANTVGNPSWNSAHEVPCSQTALASTAGSGKLYCFAE